MENTSATRQHTAHTTDQLSSPSWKQEPYQKAYFLTSFLKICYDQQAGEIKMKIEKSRISFQIIPTEFIWTLKTEIHVCRLSRLGVQNTIC